ncbi:MAG: DUF4397 domain-containing protein [Anaerotignum sp.]|nr:DUF4397 domain-containing protein [Anaerotignum sp.]
MPNNNWYETSEDMLMPLPLTEAEVSGVYTEEILTEEVPNDNARGRYPSITLPNNTSITVIPIIPGITLYGYIRFLNASPGEQRVDIYVNGRKVADSLLYREFTEYMKVFPGWYRIAVYAAGTRRNPLTVTTLRIRANDIITMAVTGLSGDISTQTINDSRRWLGGNNAYVRFVQLSPNAPAMDAYWDDALVLAELNYGDVSRYLQTTAGSHNLKMRDSLSGANLVESPDVSVENGKAYTIYIVGDINDRTGLQILVPLEGATYLDFGDNNR